MAEQIGPLCPSWEKWCQGKAAIELLSRHCDQTPFVSPEELDAAGSLLCVPEQCGITAYMAAMAAKAAKAALGLGTREGIPDSINPTCSEETRPLSHQQGE